MAAGVAVGRPSRRWNVARRAPLEPKRVPSSKWILMAKLPNNWIVGHVASVAVDSRDRLHAARPNTIPRDPGSRAPPV